MNDVAMAQAVQSAAKPKFRGHIALKSKVVTHYPTNLAREYTRITNTYMTTLNKTMAEYLPVVRRAIDAERAGMRRDDVRYVLRIIREAFTSMHSKFEEGARLFGLERKLKNLANMTSKLSIREWKRVVHKTLGIDIMDDYYKGEFSRAALDLWTTNNVSLIKTIPQDTLAKMQSIVQEGYLAGKSNTAIGREIQEAYGTERGHAQFIARDQIAKLNADLTQSQQKDAGVEDSTRAGALNIQ